MILTLNRLSINKTFLVLLVLLTVPFSVSARGLELAVTPTLFEMAAVPGQVWRSQVKTINTNPYPLTVYARVMNFAPEGESGQGKFVPVFEDFTEGTTLAEWIDIDTEAVVIPPEESAQIPFTVMVPEDASPGGHFAAILISTQPPQAEGMRVTTSQVVTSLFFARIAGDVIEEGNIREFRVANRFIQTPEAKFLVRFENKGNVHIQPQGQIEIYNMWGKERGVIPINRTTHFGNVLPNSIRQFEFTWRGEQSLSDIGRYKAIVTLGYGLDNKQFVTSTTYFYLVPLKALATVLGSMLMAFLFAAWAIKAYVRRMLALSGVDMRDQYEARRRPLVREGDVLIQKRRPRFDAPIESGWLDLKGRLAHTRAFTDTLRTLLSFTVQYKLFFLSVVGFVIIFTLLFIFVREVGQNQKDYEVTINNNDRDVTLSSEEIIYEQKHEPKTTPVVTETEVSTTTETAAYTLALINAGDVPGAAAALKARLISDGYEVDTIASDFADSRDRSVVVYAPGLEAAALAISQATNNALLSADPTASSSITVYIGNDFAFTD